MRSKRTVPAPQTCHSMSFLAEMFTRTCSNLTGTHQGRLPRLRGIQVRNILRSGLYMLCEITNGRCKVCGLAIPDRLFGKRVVRTCRVTTEREEFEKHSEADLSCRSRGELLRLEKCTSCQAGGVHPEIFACEIHGECTLGNISKRKPDGTRWQACSTCEDRKTLP